MTSPNSRSSVSRSFGLGALLLCLGYAIFLVVHLLHDPEALTSSIYTYYQANYYSHISKGQLPWIQFNIEYPPLAAYAILFPALAPGLSVFVVSALRGLFCLVLSITALSYISKKTNLEEKIKLPIALIVGTMACLVPGFYFGVFDWIILVINVYLAASIFGRKNHEDLQGSTWPLVFFGAAIKLLPALAIPFLLPFSKGKNRKNFALSSLATLLVHLPFITVGFHGLRYFVAYHRLRSIDCFSVYACVLDAAQRLGLVNIRRVWSYGAVEVQGSVSQVFSKVSLPLFAIVFLWLVVRSYQFKNLRKAFTLYLICFLLYEVISKVSQQNYVVWSISCIVGFWICGLNNQKFVWRSFAIGIALILVAWGQNAFFVGNLEAMVPWHVILINSAKHVLLIWVSFLAWRECVASKESRGRQALVPSS